MGFCAMVGLVALLDSPSARIERATIWLDAVLNHQPGASDTAIAQVSRLAIADVQTLAIDAQTLVVLMRRPGALIFYTPGPGRRQTTIRYSPSDFESLRSLAKRVASPSDEPRVRAIQVNEFLKRAALLEGDVAMLNLVEDMPISMLQAGPMSRFRLRIDDGQTVSINQAPVHWELARTLLDLVTPDPSSDPMVRAWYIATIAFNESREEHETDHLRRAASLFPTDATILWLNGCLHEAYAANRIQTALKTTKFPAGLKPDAGDARSELQLAEGFLKKAVAADPHAAEARLHFGHVLGELGHHQEAAIELRQALDGLVDDPLNEYYAALFLGREEESLGRLDAARAAYERAALRFPGAQSPYLALSQLSWRRADRNGALGSLREALSATEDDPWWAYDVAHARQADQLLEELRRPFLKPRQP